MAKEKLYESFITRLEAANADEAFLECSWYCYAVLEDRLLSFLRGSGGVNYGNGKPIRMMGPKMKELKLRKSHDSLLAAQLTDRLFDRLDKWKDDRNDLMHAMADATLTIEQIDKDAQKLSSEGKKLVRDYCAACRRYKKRLIKSASTTTS
jgi:hypothetical protein